MTSSISAGCKALGIRTWSDSFQRTMSIRSPPSSSTMFLIRVPADADAGPDGVDLGVDRGDGDLRAIAGLAGQGPDRDDLVGDLGDLQLEEAADEVGVGPAEDDLDPLADLADVEDDGADPLVGVVALAGDLLAAGQQGVGLAEVDGDRPALEPLDGAGDEVAALVLELVEEAVALGLADLLDDDLLGRLGGDPAEARRGPSGSPSLVASILPVSGSILTVISSASG